MAWKGMRTQRRALVDAGALLIINGRALIDPEKAAEVALCGGIAAARREAR